jgi:hypothetical protein
LVTSAVRATVLVPLDIKAMTERADRVVYGTVLSQRSSWNERHDAIFSDVTMRVARVYKGAVKPGDVVTVRREGGVVDGIGMRVFGAASFAVGEDAIVFLETRGKAAFTVGMTQGKLGVFTDDKGVRRVAQKVADVDFTAAPKMLSARRLDELEREIVGYVK